MILAIKIMKHDLAYASDIKECLVHNSSNPEIEKIVVFSDLDLGIDIDSKSKKIQLMKLDLGHFKCIERACRVSKDFVIYSTPFVKFDSNLGPIRKNLHAGKILRSTDSYYIFRKDAKLFDRSSIDEILGGVFESPRFYFQKIGYFGIPKFPVPSLGWKISKASLDQKEESFTDVVSVPDKREFSAPVQTIQMPNMRNIDVVIVSVDYNDFLEITLEKNRKIFDRITVVTSTSDKRCVEICEKMGAKAVVTDCMYSDGAEFNKGKAINEGLASLKDPEFVLILDADIIVPDMDIDFPLAENTIYYRDRIMLRDYGSYERFEQGSSDFETESLGPVGYFQLFKYRSKLKYAESSSNAAWSDVRFIRNFRWQKKIESPVLHLGEDRKNWSGRTTPDFKKKDEFDLNSYFDKIYCINLDNRKDRWRKAIKSMEMAGIYAERISAIDGRSLDFWPKMAEEHSSNKGHIENAAALGCLMTHLKVVKDAKSKGYKKILILEDDVLFSKDFASEAAAVAEKDWNMLYLGASQFDWSGISPEDGFYRCKNTLGTFAYALDCSIYDNVIKEFERMDRSADNALASVQKRIEGCYVFFPNIAISDVSDSDIRKEKDMKEYSKSMRWDLNFFSLNIPSKVAFLFLTVSGLKLKSEWERFFSNANMDSYSIYSHSSSNTGQDIIDRNSISSRIETKWADISIVDATNLLIEEALKDPCNDYMVLLSESCVPVYSFDFTYEKICEEDKSWIYYYKWDHKHNEHRWAKMIQHSSESIGIDRFYKQSQFMILKRSHAKTIMEKKKIYDFSKVNVPDEHYYINILKNEIPEFDSENVCFPATNVYRHSGKTGSSTNPIDSLVIYDIPDCRDDFGEAKKCVDENSISLFFRKVSENTDIIRKQGKKMNPEIAIFNLYRISEILKSNCVTHWITDGTLLGAIREGGFISHDTDTDIGVLFSTFSRDAYDSLVSAGFSIRHVFGYPNDSLEISLERDGVKTDLFFFYQEEGRLRHSAFSEISKKGYYRVDYSYDYFGVSEFMFMRKIFYMPEDPMKFIITKYGDDWNIPKKEWHWATSPLNAVQTGEYIYREESAKRFKSWLESQKLAKITLLIKSFMRRDCVDRLISSIRERYAHIRILIVDDSHPNNYFGGYNIDSIGIDFDSGLSKGRNHGVSLIETPYFILLDDDFVFTENTDLERFIEIFEESGLDLLGGQVIENGKNLNYFGSFDYDSRNKILSVKPRFENKGIFNKCDIVLNFFIAKTEKIRKFRWDDDLKLAEHTAFFYDNLGKIKVGYTEEISILHMKKREEAYSVFRNRGSYFFNKWLSKKGIDRYFNIKGELFERYVEDSKKVVITYGTFDTFHYGHLELLRRAKSLGDYLIVGVSTDEFNSIKGKKSKFEFSKRKEWVESISFVDLVIPENNWEQKIIDVQYYSVDKFVMGDDWKGKFDYLKCEVVYLERTENISSTQIKRLS